MKNINIQHTKAGPDPLVIRSSLFLPTIAEIKGKKLNRNIISHMTKNGNGVLKPEALTTTNTKKNTSINIKSQIENYFILIPNTFIYFGASFTGSNLFPLSCIKLE